MKKRILSAIIAMLVLCTVLFNMSSCIMVSAVDLMDGIEPREVREADLDALNESVTDFAVRIFIEMENGENLFLSPMSILFALAMTSNGAAGETLAQMELVFGIERDELNEYLHTYINSLNEGEKTKLGIANSIWFKKDPLLTVNQSFLQKNADYYGAEIYKTSFDMTTLADINSWVRRETRGMIPSIIESISSDTIMYLINTIAFEAEWATTYKSTQVKDGIFTKEDGTEQRAEFMYCTEGKFIEDENATGFIKRYKGNYAFVALLPNEGVSISDYIASLNGEGVASMLASSVSTTVRTSLPKFSTKFEADIADVLYSMGMTDAFDVDLADFSQLGSYEEQNIYIGNVLHKTFIDVEERGTKAGAVTVVSMKDGSAAPPEDPKEVYLDRPFVYMIIDTENNIPLFIGSMTDVKN
ncbi:MAG: serpin family protein [Clostridia bacterium]|nr:serpin family protein [Clostridia bacterium]